MGRLDLFTDPTGHMTQQEVTQQNISNIMDELNRNSDQLDTLTDNLSILSRGSLAASGAQGNVSANFSVTAAYTFIAFYNIGLSPGLLLPVPNNTFDVNSNQLTGVFAYSSSQSGFGSNTGSLTFSYFSTVSTTWTFYYYILQQPANVALS